MFTIIFPVLNERLRLENGVTRTVEYLHRIAFEDYEIIIVDNGSEDDELIISDVKNRKASCTGEAIHLFETQEEIQYINGSRFARESDTKGRKWYRKITSQGLLILLKLFLRMKSTDAICGFTFVRRETAISLIRGCSQDNGWFYMIEFLLRAEKRGVKILDYPVEWQEDYNTTVKVFKTICNYLVQIARLFNEFYIKKHI